MKATSSLHNPVILQRADPWVYKHIDGWYYFTATSPGYDCIEVRKSLTLQGLAEAETVVVWRKHEEGKLSELIWAPEIHHIDGKWYIYFAAAWSNQPFKGVFDHCSSSRTSLPIQLKVPGLKKGRSLQIGSPFRWMQQRSNTRARVILFGRRRIGKCPATRIYISPR